MMSLLLYAKPFELYCGFKLYSSLACVVAVVQKASDWLLHANEVCERHS
jgi:hypothetical protein